jgi:hypothetical protein
MKTVSETNSTACRYEILIRRTNHEKKYAILCNKVGFIREVAAMNKRVTASDWVGNKITMKQLITWYKTA